MTAPSLSDRRRGATARASGVDGRDSSATGRATAGLVTGRRGCRPSPEEPRSRLSRGSIGNAGWARTQSYVLGGLGGLVEGRGSRHLFCRADSGVGWPGCRSVTGQPLWTPPQSEKLTSPATPADRSVRNLTVKTLEASHPPAHQKWQTQQHPQKTLGPVTRTNGRSPGTRLATRRTRTSSVASRTRGARHSLPPQRTSLVGRTHAVRMSGPTSSKDRPSVSPGARTTARS